MPARPVVLDTNVFVAARFNPRSASAQILEAVRDGRLSMIWDDATRREIEHILGRIPPLRARGISDVFRPEDRFTEPTHPERFSMVADPDDRKFAALAAAAGATLISNDEHLLGWRDRLEIPIVSPGEFVGRRSRS